MEKQYDYVTKPDVKYNHLQKMDIPAMISECKDKWFNQTLSRVNESVVRLGIVEGEYHWHKTDNDDEFFFVLEGQLLIDMEERIIVLNPNEGVNITKGVMHRPRAPKRTVMPMVETASIEPTGN